MGWFSDFFTFENIAPIAAGALTGGLGYGLMAATAAGAATGGGIAALQGKDIAAGAIGGGLGGFSGGGLNAAFNPGSQLKNTIAQPGLANAAAGTNPAAVPTGSSLTTGNTATVFSGEGAMGPSMIQANPSASGFASANQIQAGQTAFGQAPLSLGDQFAAAPVRFGGGLDTSLNTNFMSGLERYGGGGKFAGLNGAGKLGFSAVAPGIMGDLTNPPGFEEFETPDKYKYDPTRRLNLGDDIDSGLRLLANGGYLEGGGVGDGMSDDIPATIDQEQPAALSEGEFVIPADVVSHIGNGSSNAGARRLYDMMATIREARTGNSKQGVEIEAEEYMPYNMVESQSQRF